MYKNNSISIIIPCYNEEMAIKSVLHEIPSYIDEVIVVDNNSAD
jgi:glycosyltransferase involved in cell wall biosynthesis